MKKYISFSGGVESTTMCILYGKGSTAIWCDTGDEEDVMYERVDYCENRLKEIHNGDFKLLRIKPEVKAKGVYTKSISECSMIWGFPSQQKRWCTNYFKIKPIDNFLSEQGVSELMIGFNADEVPNVDRIGNLMKCKNVSYTYPLYEDGHTRIDCEMILEEYGLLPNFPVYMKRGGCKHCFFKSRKELKAKYIIAPEDFIKDEEFENELNRNSTRKKFYAINISAGTYKSIRMEAENEIRMFGRDVMIEQYKKIESHKPCGEFCHR